MLSAKVCASLNPMIVFWLAKELEKEIPDLDLHASERSLLHFACKDLETWLKMKRGDANSDELKKALNVRDNQEEIKAFLKVWTKQWLEKWRERVTLCQKRLNLLLVVLDIQSFFSIIGVCAFTLHI